ncbi:23S rRNA (pseudouridine(1915)-N(3))-methyltransferase RlmH [Acetanaerobacterium elongatum]|uniref:Ribosomal RNA large subunit methyltransferase H n=1 Tax=Acetanaerobacterium elongatum TaxID=258515 RepID=A0A1H0AF45_9FIRM|nr:23S rRNA (pseudouridine(1915)-N(3))-methyltransferase RlmH [Acetanaerobacterium elongatum]SDN31921.1 23S rRNA (pseudouridine1915-N3)-methyltransferase [Acetanaerobacterium elongatum]
MISVTILCVGKLKEDYLRAACAEYLKRLGAFCKASVVELNEARLPEKPSQAQITAALAEEGKSILAKIPNGSYTAALCIEGERFTSERLADRMASAAASGKSSLVFIIGGSFGLSDEVKNACALRLSMSDMTFPHQLARVMLLEQVYRAFSINANTKYHK